jgi:hypothetical protein
MWKFLNQSVAGTSHLEARRPCQDYSSVVPYKSEDDEILIVACSDGAGSAPQSQIGSELACKTVVAQAVAFLGSGRSASEINREILRSWFGEAHEQLKAEALRRQAPLREFSCTLLMGVIGETTAAFAQVGDGAIVVRDGSEYRTVFWPDSGEYHNSTYFAVDPNFSDHLQTKQFHCQLQEIALLSDGLQMLALDYATMEAHSPFFRPMFMQLRENATADLVVPMRKFLDSKAVNDLTDDDKTLVLASRNQTR